MTRGLRVGSDIDEVLADFMGAYLKRFGAPKNDLEITDDIRKKSNTLITGLNIDFNLKPTDIQTALDNIKIC